MRPDESLSNEPPKNASLKQAYREHVARLAKGYGEALASSGYDRVLVYAGSLKPWNRYDDQYFPFKVTPHFAHWVPLRWPGSALEVGLSGPAAAGARRPRLFAHRDRSYWERAPEPDWDFFADAFEVVEVTSLDRVAAERERSGRVAFVGEDRARAHAWGFADEDIDPPALLSRLDALRTLKSEYEIACIAEANRRAALGHHAVAKAFREGQSSELELHLAYLLASGQDDPETPYKNIVAMGPNAAILHHVHYGRTPSGQGPRSLLLDAGASVNGYASDVTRTHLAGSGPTADAYRALLDKLDRMQRELCARVRIGDPFESLHDRCHTLLGTVLLELGIFRRDQIGVDQLVQSGVTRKFLPHGLGHSLGLQTHDVGCLKTPPRAENPWLRNTSPVTPGQVFTIEPGIYFVDTLLDELRAMPESRACDWSLVEALRPFGGVRIEDDLWVVGAAAEGAGATVTTTRNLTREALSD